jgi:hypothetical protein
VIPKLIMPGQAYAGRRDEAVVVNVTIDQAMAAVLRKYGPEGRKGTGKFLARLFYEHEAREQERVRLREHIRAVIGEGKGLQSIWARQVESPPPQPCVISTQLKGKPN